MNTTSFAYIQLLFHSAQGNPLMLLESSDNFHEDQFTLSMFYVPTDNSSRHHVPIKAYRLKALDQFIHDSNYNSTDNDQSDTEVPLINADDIQAFPGGISYTPQYIVCFNMKVENLNSFTFKIRVTLYSKSEAPGRKLVVCESFHSSRQLKTNSTGSITGALITDTLQVVGSLNFDYLITSPWPNYQIYRSLSTVNIVPNRDTIIVQHWVPESCSNGLTTEATNTEAPALNFEGRKKFAGIVVQLTRDMAVVVFRDFLTEPLADKDSPPIDNQCRLKIPLRDLSHHQLTRHKFVNSTVTTNQDSNDTKVCKSNSSSGSTFPLAGEAITSLPQDVGMFIEVKFPQQESNGSWELEGSYFDRTIVVEKVLDEVFSHNNANRLIIFSSFDPGICILLRQKQKHYPVLFQLASQETQFKYMDVRSHDIKTAITFCLAEKLHGLCAEVSKATGNISKTTHLVHSNNLLFMVWATNLDVQSFMSKQTENVDGIICE